MMAPPRILLIGDQGQLAWELRRALATLGEVVAVGRGTAPHRLDLTEGESIAPLVATLQPRWIVNAAAHTAVDKAESEPDLARALNAEAPARLAEAARQHDALLLHYSTDYVFDGAANRPYLETDSPNPQNVYGASKLAGEQAVAAVGGPHLILRTAWVYGQRGQNFMRTIRRLARERTELRVVADQRGAPTWSRHIAEATAQILAQLGDDRARWRADSGIYHVTSAGETSWHGFAEAIVAHQRRHETLPLERLTAISTAEYPTPARRPAHSVLANDKIGRVFGIHLPHWSTALRQVQEDLDSPLP